MHPSSTYPSWIPWCLGHVPAALIPSPKLAYSCCNFLCHAGPSITDPVVRDTVLSCRKGWQINFSTDWWAVMQLSGLLMVQHHGVERPATKNRSQELRGGASSLSVIMNRVRHCLGCNIIFFQAHWRNRNELEVSLKISWIFRIVVFWPTPNPNPWLKTSGFLYELKNNCPSIYWFCKIVPQYNALQKKKTPNTDLVGWRWDYFSPPDIMTFVWFKCKPCFQSRNDKYNEKNIESLSEQTHLSSSYNTNGFLITFNWIIAYCLRNLMPHLLRRSQHRIQDSVYRYVKTRALEQLSAVLFNCQ